jgi:hypothetical protein
MIIARQASHDAPLGWRKPGLGCGRFVACENCFLLGLFSVRESKPSELHKKVNPFFSNFFIPAQKLENNVPSTEHINRLSSQ